MSYDTHVWPTRHRHLHFYTNLNTNQAPATHPPTLFFLAHFLKGFLISVFLRDIRMP